jgi:hypothetical protein
MDFVIDVAVVVAAAEAAERRKWIEEKNESMDENNVCAPRKGTQNMLGLDKRDVCLQGTEDFRLSVRSFPETADASNALAGSSDGGLLVRASGTVDKCCNSGVRNRNGILDTTSLTWR